MIRKNPVTPQQMHSITKVSIFLIAVIVFAGGLGKSVAAQNEVIIESQEIPNTENMVVVPNIPVENDTVIQEPSEPLPPPPPEPPPKLSNDFNYIHLQGLNKVTARVSGLEAPLGTLIRFGNLEIIAWRCWQSLPEERPETAALLEIRESKPGEGDPKTIFSGWMYASSPALSALEHPVYDIRVLECENKETEE